MPLLRLPPETLRQIFDYLDSSFFHEDLGRLTVCKQWLDFALPACYKCITLSPETLRKLTTSGVMKRRSSLENSLDTLVLNLRGYYPPFTSYYQEYAQGSVSLQTLVAYRARSDDLAKAWIKSLNYDLAQLAITAQRSRKLRALHIRAWGSPSTRTYLSLSTMRAILSVENLSVLVLDLSGTSLDSSGHQGNGFHICPNIAATLRTLRTLHVRMRSICPDVLKPEDADENLQLSVVVINLSHVSNQPEITSAAHSERCGSEGGGLIQLKADIYEQAEALATRLASPKVMRILFHTLPQFDTHSLDVLSGKIMIMDDDVAWDKDGKTVQEDSEPESELLDENFSGFFESDDE
ncbi:hypothetical protein IL306_013750 [Fusarium sp. DS 682]|nr:hypothetical protein IL306_013750 [Fusarium sp. DS 682]